MTLGAPAWLHLLWLVPVAALGLWRAARWRRETTEALFGAGLLEGALPEGLERRRAWGATLLLLGIALCALAAAQPRWGFTWQESASEGVEIVIGLDVSTSMDAQDVDPSRLERGKREVLDLLELLPSDRVGLVIFAGGAYPRVPLTLDHEALRSITRDLETQTLQAQGSSLAAALTESLGLFDMERELDRAIVLISDGEAWDDDLDEPIAAAAAAGIRIYTVGVGTAGGAPIPIGGGGFKTDRAGEVVLTRLDADTLQRIAASTEGAYVTSVAGSRDGRELAAEIRSAMQTQALQVRREKIWDERFQWPLAAGVVLLFLGGLLGDPRRASPKRASIVLAFLLLAAPGTARAGSLDDARRAIAEGDSAQAVEILTELQVADPDDLRVVWSMGEALYGAGRYAESNRAFEQVADRALDTDLRLDARYNAGNAAYREGRLEDAVEAWRQVLEQDPEHADAAANAEAVEKEIAARQDQPPPEDNQDGDPQDGEPQEGDTGQSDTGQSDTGDSQDTAEPDESDSEQDPQDQPQDQSGERDEDEQDTGELDPTEASMDDLDQRDTGEEEEESAAAAEPLEEGVGEMSPEEAARLLEGAEEGRPRVVIRGRPSGNDW